MIHNDILRRLRYAMDFKNAEMLAMFELGKTPIDIPTLHAIMAKEGDPEFIMCSDRQLSSLLDGMIIEHRGKQEGREPRPLDPGQRINNNQILQKLRIALKLTDTDMIEILAEGGHAIAKAELTALFRKPDHRNYKQCGDQLLRNFLVGLAGRYRDG